MSEEGFTKEPRWFPASIKPPRYLQRVKFITRMGYVCTGYYLHGHFLRGDLIKGYRFSYENSRKFLWQPIEPVEKQHKEEHD